MKLLVFDSELTLAAQLGADLADALRARPDLVLGLPTGRTPLALYADLVARSERDGLDWSRVRTFNLDEFVGLGQGDAGSYHAFMAARLFDHVNVQPAHVGFLDGRAPDLEAECRRYEAAIAAAGGIDLMILGIGANGHIGFNEPAAALQARTHVAVLDPESRAANTMWFGGELARVPDTALSMGMATILGARAVVLLATGENKAEAVAGMLEGPLTTALPASFLQLHPAVTVLVDEAAAGEISRRAR